MGVRVSLGGEVRRAAKHKRDRTRQNVAQRR